MCGIAGFIDTENNGRVRESKALLDKMCQVILHRGPDEQGMSVRGRAALGMRRLSIIDLKTGQQPIYSTDGTKLIVFNGEIYNYRELKIELESLGYRFKTNSDTETIIHAFDEWGPDCLERLRGMFAFAIWDETAQSLFMARDRVGKKPLFYEVLDDGTFVFGSEIKCLLTYGGRTREVDPSALNSYLTFGYVPEEYCILKGVKKLPPGHYLWFKNGQVSQHCYWDFEYPESYPEVSERHLVVRLQDELRDAVEARLISDVPLGAFLSGGIDSSAIVGMMSRILDQPVKTFSIGFHEDTFNELKYARLAAKHFNTEHHEFIVTADLVETVEDLVWHLDEPFSDPSTMPTYMVSKMAREFVTVVLSGDGGDELFGGYTRYSHQMNRRGVAALPYSFRKNLLRPISETLPHAAMGRNYLYNNSFEGIERYIDSVSQFGRLKKRELYSSLLKERLGGSVEAPEALFLEIAKTPGAVDDLSRLLYLDSKTYLPADILTKVDRMSMAASLEARVPLLDQNLVGFVTKCIPPNMKLRGRESKYIFKKALKGMVPDEILYREKQGFGVPIADWINSKLRKNIVNTLLEKRTMDRGYFEERYVKTLIAEHSSGRRDHSHPLWALWILELWHRRYLDH